MKPFCLTAIGLLSVAAASPFDYHGYKVFRVTTGYEIETDFLEDYLSDFTYDIYGSDNRGNLSVAIAPYNVTAFEALGLHTSVLHDDLGADMDAESGNGSGGGQDITMALQATGAQCMYTDNVPSSA